MYDYAKRDFDGLRNALCSDNLTGVVGKGCLESCGQTWKDLCLAAAKDSIPTKELNPVPWLTGAVINLIKKKGNRSQETAHVGVTKSQI